MIFGYTGAKLGVISNDVDKIYNSPVCSRARGAHCAKLRRNKSDDVSYSWQNSSSHSCSTMARDRAPLTLRHHLAIVNVDGKSGSEKRLKTEAKSMYRSVAMKSV